MARIYTSTAFFITGGINPMFPVVSGSGNGGCTGPFCMGAGNGGSGGARSGGGMMGGPRGVSGKYWRPFLLLLLAGHEIRHRLSNCDVIEPRIAAGRGITGEPIYTCPVFSSDRGMSSVFFRISAQQHTKCTYTVTIT
ncbi:hypothetical protein DPMN_033339 [Dreissena polymorpha]|uniref:Uncharacterized protein n=1 Tax=Dreissena polymorpha TaxID=45954 RepID=A0A9D4M3H1_DREPO|nr:hypothetical protein DPMN_033339 [Dreissena polymorpha]